MKEKNDNSYFLVQTAIRTHNGPQMGGCPEV